MWWSNGLVPGAASGSSRPRSRRAAIAMPTALARPWPSGPVVVSTPGVCRCSGWPGVRLPQVRSRLQVVQGQPVAGQVQLDIQGQAGMPAGQHETVPAEPVRVRRVMPQDVLEQQVGGRGEAHRRARVAGPGLLHRVHGQHPDQVDGPVVGGGPVQGGLRGLLTVASGSLPEAAVTRLTLSPDCPALTGPPVNHGRTLAGPPGRPRRPVRLRPVSLRPARAGTAGSPRSPGPGG